MSSGLLVNIGTGGQVSRLSDNCAAADPLVEARPCVEGKYLLAGSALCSGRAFALLETFFSEVITMATGVRPTKLYDIMEQWAQQVQEPSLAAATTFCGTRLDSTMRGQLRGIGVDNFTPGQVTLGVLKGIAQELYSLYLLMDTGKKPQMLVGSGNGLRKTLLLQEIFSGYFGLPLLIPAHQEEASFGAALFALVCCGHVKNMTTAQEVITYL